MLTFNFDYHRCFIQSLQKRPKRSSDIVYDFAPGEKKRLTNWIREKNNDRKAFPELFDDGKNGLDDVILLYKTIAFFYFIIVV